MWRGKSSAFKVFPVVEGDAFFCHFGQWEVSVSSRGERKSPSKYIINVQIYKG